MPLIVFEGIDGSGKATQIKKLASLLRSRKIPFTLHKYPTKKTPQIQSYLKGRSPLSPRTKFFLYLLDILLGQEKIRKEAESGKTILLDRYTLSTIAYSQDPEYEKAKTVVSSFNFLPPDKIFLLDLPPELSQKRKERQKILDIHESNLSLQKKVRKNYLSLAREKFLCRNWAAIDASKSQEEVFAQIKNEF